MHEPFRNMMLDSGDSLSEFEAKDSEAVSGNSFKEPKDRSSWYGDPSVAESAGTVTSQLVEPVPLGPLTEAHPDATFASEYMPDWRTGGSSSWAKEEEL